MINVELYKSVLRKLSQIPADYLTLIDNFLSALDKKLSKKEENRKAIMALAGSWSAMSEDDFEEFRRITKETGDELFNRETDL